MSEARDRFDVVIVGAGPAGIAAAVTLGEANRSVALVDEGAFAGGQIWRNRGGHTVAPEARRWLDRLAKCPTVTRIAQSRIAALLSPGTMLIENPSGARLLEYASLLIATGARERFIPFPGWTLPNVFGAGAIQALIKSGMPVKGKSVVVAGTGPLLLAVADLLRAKGAIVPAVIEQASASSVFRFGASLLREPAKLVQAIQLRGRAWRTRYLTSSHPLRVDPLGDRLRLTYSTRGTSRSIDCDLIGCGFNLIPNVELARSVGCEVNAAGEVVVGCNRQTTVPHIYAAGEVTGIGGVEKALIEGEVAARAIAGLETQSLQARLDRALRFARRLDTAFAIRADCHAITTPQTIICRCEDVPLEKVSRCLNARDAKLQTRCGMGPCQGRVCGPTVEHLFGVDPQRSRPPLIAASVGTLASLGQPKPKP